MAITPEEIRAMRDMAHGKPRDDGARPIHGYSRKQQTPARGSNLDEFYARQRGARSFEDPRFPGQSAPEIAREMNRRGERTGVGGNGIEPDMPMPSRYGPSINDERRGGIPRQGHDVPVNEQGGYGPATPRSGFKEEGYDVPVNEKGGYDKPPSSGDPFSVGPSTRQPIGSENNPYTPPVSQTPPPTRVDQENSPANFRQMSRDAEMNRSVTRTGPEGNSRITGISSRYGTGTSTFPEPGQKPMATTTDQMGRTVPMGDYLKDREETQSSRGMAPFPPVRDIAGAGDLSPAQMREQARTKEEPEETPEGGAEPEEEEAPEEEAPEEEETEE